MAESRQILSLDFGWLFHAGDVSAPLANTHLAGYMFNKAGYSRGAARSAYDDSDWRAVNLPHDWSIEGPFDPDNHVNQGFLPRGIGWYRRHFRIDESAQGKVFKIRFDGVATRCQVYINGHLLHQENCGYTSFTVDFTDVATYGDALNTIAVRVDSNYVEGWWYEGSGIYRHVWLIQTGALQIAEDGVFVKPVRNNNGTWSTWVRATICNQAYVGASFALQCTITDSDGNTLGESRYMGQMVPARSELEVATKIIVTNPLLWSLEEPVLYHCHVELARGSHTERRMVRFGYRTIRFDAKHGFYLNEKRVRIQGTCNHQDHGGLGVAVPDSIQRFRINLLKSMGCNAYRCSHHPPSPELLDICDELGMLVMDENRNFGTSPEHLKQLRSMVERDRNHPSVILWSVCNEESIQGTPAAREITRAMVHEVKRLDDSRPVTAAISGGILNDDSMSDVIDVLSINYQLPSYDSFIQKRPKLPIVASETHCAQSTRGVYVTDAAKHQFSSYDEDHAPWGLTARTTWRSLSPRANVAGIFIWTGFDYRGEPSPHEWPSVTSHWGLFDLCGFEKDTVYLHRAWWTKEAFVHILPHWNSPSAVDGLVRVKVYSNCDEAELFLNGASLGRKKIDPIEMAEWSVEYAPGRLEATGYREGASDVRQIIETTGPAVAVGMEVHPKSPSAILADRTCALPINLFAIDSAGRRVPDALFSLKTSVSGEGALIGVANGDPTNLELPKGDQITLFNGLAQAVVQTTMRPGVINIQASALGLKPATLQLQSSPCDFPFVPAAKKRHIVGDWQMSRITNERPALNIDFNTSDMNTFERVQPSSAGQSAWVSNVGYAQYRTRLKLPKLFQSRGGTVVFHSIAGMAQAYLNEIVVAKKLEHGPGPLEIRLSPTTETQVLSLVIHSTANVAGLLGQVELVGGDENGCD